MTLQEAIAYANSLLPGTPAPEGERDERWQAIIAVGQFIEAEPLLVWASSSSGGHTTTRMFVLQCPRAFSNICSNTTSTRSSLSWSKRHAAVSSSHRRFEVVGSWGRPNCQRTLHASTD
jgi:hypothetical protein